MADWAKIFQTAAPYVQAGAKMAGSAAAGRAKGRADEAGINSTRDQLSNQQFNTQQSAQMNAGGLDLQRKQFTEDARGNRAHQAMVASMLAGFTPTSIDVPGVPRANISGGITLGEGGKQAANEMMKQALLAQMQGGNGETFTGGKLLAPPVQTPLPQAGKMDSVLGALGTYGSMAGSMADLMKQKYGTKPGFSGDAGDD